VILPRHEQGKEGPWEVEVSYGGEADLKEHLTGCEKNRGHLKFISVDTFNADHLPAGCDKIMVDVVKALADLTVRVSVKYVSDRRPETVRGTSKRYPCYKDRGSNMMRTGTGWVCGVRKYPDNTNIYLTCQCLSCLDSPTPKLKFAHIHIYTAAHVVYDDLEAAQTTCDLFFDQGSTTDVCEGVVTLMGMSFERSDDERDLCEIRYVTHDPDLIHTLGKMVDHWNALGNRLRCLYSNLESKKQKMPAEFTSIPLDTLTIIVSHPHGCSKQVTFGYYDDSRLNEDGYLPLTYTTATCPGSSGARVLELKRGIWSYWNGDLVHSGACEDDTGLNFSNNVLF
jgi:hypothetical protein